MLVSSTVEVINDRNEEVSTVSKLLLILLDTITVDCIIEGMVVTLVMSICVIVVGSDVIDGRIDKLTNVVELTTSADTIESVNITVELVVG